MAWVVLVFAGLLEVAWVATLPATNGLTRPAPTVLFALLLVASMAALARASGSIPLGTAYAVWVGIGAVGATVVGVVVHHDPISPARLWFVAMLIAAIVGVKLTGVPR